LNEERGEQWQIWIIGLIVMVTGKVKQKDRLLKSSPQDERFLSFTDKLPIIPYKNLKGTQYYADYDKV
jgi:hypothetical protein